MVESPLNQIGQVLRVEGGDVLMVESAEVSRVESGDVPMVEGVEVLMVEGGEMQVVEGAPQEEAQKCAPELAALGSWSSRLSTYILKARVLEVRTPQII